MYERLFVLAAAFALDFCLGDPHWLWHPVQGMGTVIKYTEKLLVRVLGIREGREQDIEKKKLAGLIIVAVVLTVTALCVGTVMYVSEHINHYFRLAVELLMCYQTLAARSLCSESMKVYRALSRGDIEDARNAVSMIVGRDTKLLDEEGITKAAVETIAENTSDGVIAPLLYMALGGVYGAFLYKAVNTMDSMLGYRNDRYIYMGRCAARLDDVVNYIPSRISALCMLAASLLPGYDTAGAWRIYRRDKRNHASPNSAQTESVCAGALSVRLAGDAYYFGRLYSKPYIGDPVKAVTPEDIKRADRLMYIASVIALFLSVTVILMVMTAMKYM